MWALSPPWIPSQTETGISPWWLERWVLFLLWGRMCHRAARPYRLIITCSDTPRTHGTSSAAAEEAQAVNLEWWRHTVLLLGLDQILGVVSAFQLPLLVSPRLSLLTDILGWETATMESIQEEFPPKLKWVLLLEQPETWSCAITICTTNRIMRISPSNTETLSLPTNLWTLVSCLGIKKWRSGIAWDCEIADAASQWKGPWVKPYCALNCLGINWWTWETSGISKICTSSSCFWSSLMGSWTYSRKCSMESPLLKNINCLPWWTKFPGSSGRS